MSQVDITMKPSAKRSSLRTTIIDVEPVRREIVSASEFRRLVAVDPFNIARSRFISPKVGQKDFGRFEVEYSVPVLKQFAES